MPPTTASTWLFVVLEQGVYKFNWINFQEISGGISIKIQDMFALLLPAIQCTESTSLPKYRTKTWFAQHGAVAKIKRATTFLNKRSGTSFIMTGNQCSRSSTFYTRISRRTIQIQGDFQDFQRLFKFQEISRTSRSCRHPGEGARHWQSEAASARHVGQCGAKGHRWHDWPVAFTSCLCPCKKGGGEYWTVFVTCIWTSS